jgi:predicted permease
MPDSSWREPLRARLASLSLSPEREAEIIDELSQHLDECYEELRTGGASDAEARRLAIEELLDRDALAEEMRSLRQAHVPAPITPGAPTRFLFDLIRQDLRYTARALLKQPGFAAAAIVTLALGIGATTSIFTVVNSVLINPLPYPNSDALVRIVHSIGGIEQPYFSDAFYVSYADHSQAFQDVGVWIPEMTATVTGRGEPEEVRTLPATRSVLTTLGVQPAIGRWFSTAEDAPGALDTVMLGYRYWQRAFGGDRAVLDRTLIVNARPHQIVGVMPAGFRFDGEHDLILPLRINRGRQMGGFRLLGVARLKPDITVAQANADASRVLDVHFSQPGRRPEVRARWAPSHRLLKDEVVGDVGTTLWVLMGTITIVLLMACANVANLLLVRAAAQRQEFAVRAALGAGWTRLARQLLVESLTLGVLGGALGLGLAYMGLRVLLAIQPSDLPRLTEISLDRVVVTFAVMISLASGLLFGLVPIVKFARPRLADALGHSRSGDMTREGQRSQQTLVAMQVALALVLLVSAGLMIRSFQALRHVDAGFTQPAHVQTFTISIPPTIVAEPQRVTRMQHDLLNKVAAIPSVEAVAFTTRVPMGSDRWSAALTAEGRPDNDRTPPNHQVKIISPGMFDTLGTPLVVGRDFTWNDVDDIRDVAIVSENLARLMWGSPEAALGKRVREYYDAKSAWREIVGVAHNVYDDGADQRPPMTIYWPAQPHARSTGGLSGFLARRVSFVVRTPRAGTESLFAQMREAVSSVSPSLPLADVRTLDQVYGQSMARASFTLVMLAIAGAMALMLGVSGLYGVIAYAVSQRRREIGIRMALGAEPRDIRRLFLRRGVILAGVGMAIGLAGAVGFSRFLHSLLFGVTPLDPIAFTAMPLVLAAAAMLASYLPARRAIAVDPAKALRAE